MENLAVRRRSKPRGIRMLRLDLLSLINKVYKVRTQDYYTETICSYITGNQVSIV